MMYTPSAMNTAGMAMCLYLPTAVLTPGNWARDIPLSAFKGISLKVIAKEGWTILEWVYRAADAVDALAKQDPEYEARRTGSCCWNIRTWPGTSSTD